MMAPPPAEIPSSRLELAGAGRVRSGALVPVAGVHLRVRVRHRARRLPAAHVSRARLLAARAARRQRRAQRHAAARCSTCATCSRPTCRVKFCFLFYVFVNQSLLSLPTAERSERLLYLPAWLADSRRSCSWCSCSPPGCESRPFARRRCVSPLSLVCAGLLLSLAALCCWLAPITWPASECASVAPLLAHAVALQLMHLVLSSLLSLASNVAMRLLPARFLQIQTLLECVRLAIVTTLVILELRLYVQSISAGEWNAVTLVRAARGVDRLDCWRVRTRPEALQPPEDSALAAAAIDGERDADFVARVRANAPDESQQEECPICREPFTETAIAEVARTPCRHYFHARCLTAWFLSQPRRSCPLCRQQMGVAAPSDRNRRSGFVDTIFGFVDTIFADADLQEVLANLQRLLALFSAAVQLAQV